MRLNKQKCNIWIIKDHKQSFMETFDSWEKTNSKLKIWGILRLCFIGSLKEAMRKIIYY